MASPHVSGIASLLKGYNSNLDNDDIENIIRLSADKVPGMLGNDFTIQYGYGRVNARTALDYLRAPYELNQWTASGGTSVNSTGTFSILFFGANGLSDGYYLVKRYEVRKTVSFQTTYCAVDGAWGRGVNTTGWSLEVPNYGMGFCEVVPGSLTETSCDLRTYVYQVWNVSGQYLGYKPCSPSQVAYAYSVLGIPNPSLSITGPSLVCTSNSTFTLQNTPSGSTVTWSVSPGTHVTPYSGNGSSATFHLSSCNSIGNEQVTFAISNSCGTIQVSKAFIAGGPDPTDVNLDVWLSSGQHANKYGSTWVLCPNENYEIFVINNSSCTTFNYTWILPSSLTRNYAYNNMISVHTNSHPGGNILVKAQTCCSGCGSNVQILSDYVGTDYNCGYGYMSFTPNPTADETTLELKTENIEKYTVGDEWSLEIVNRQQVIIQKTTNLKDNKYVIHTSGWKEGLYFVRVMIHNNMYSGKFVVAR